MSGLRILGLCNPLLDISSEVDQAFLDKYEVRAGAACLASESHLPMYDELSARPDVQFIPGGSALNTIRVANWQLKEAGHEGLCAFSGAVGKDAVGENLVSLCEKEGLTMACYVHPEHPTGTCAVGILERERMLCANLGAAQHFPTSHLASHTLLTEVIRTDLVYISGFFFLTNAEVALNVARAASKAGKRVAINLSAEFIVQVAAQHLAEVYEHVDFIFCNETEAEAWRAANKDGLAAGIEEKDIRAITVALANIPGKTTRLAVVTQGAEPTLTASYGDKVAAEHVVPAIPKEAVLDTNGAGDAFVGGFLAALAAGESVVDAVARGNRAARVIIQNSGCQWATLGI